MEKPHEIVATLTERAMDVCAIQATWLDEDSERINVEGYTFLGQPGYKTGGRTGGGSGFMVKHGIQDMLVTWNTQKFKQAQWLRIDRRKRSVRAGRDLYIATAYVRPVGSARTVTQWAIDAEYLFQDLEHLRSKGHTVLIGADMNGRVGRALDDDDKVPMWGEQASNEQGRCLVDHLHQQDLHLLRNRTPYLFHLYPCPRLIRCGLPHQHRRSTAMRTRGTHILRGPRYVRPCFAQCRREAQDQAHTPSTQDARCATSCLAPC